VTDTLAQQMLDLIHRNSAMRRTEKDALSDWILDTQSRTELLNTRVLLDHLATHQADVLSRLQNNVSIPDEIAQVLREADRGRVPLDHARRAPDENTQWWGDRG
jgi:hypothetical protein